MQKDLTRPLDGGTGCIRISVIIPALNEEKVIGRCMESLVRNDFSRNEFEVIVVDNGSRDKTIEIARSFESHLLLRILQLTGVHISALRNRGAAIANGKFLAFLDADCIPHPGWLANASRLLEEPGSGIVGAHYQIPEDATWVGRVWCEDRSAEKVGDVSYVPAGDLLIRREVFSLLGGFDESIQTNEDLELCRRAASAGFAVRSYPQLGVVHLGTPRTLPGFYKKQRWHGTHVLTVFLRDPEKRRNRRPVILSLYTISCLILVLGGCIWGMGTGKWLLVVLSLLVYLGPFFLIACLRTIPRGKWRETLPLMVLYLTFGLARAESVLRVRTWWRPYRKVKLPITDSLHPSSRSPS